MPQRHSKPSRSHKRGRTRRNHFPMPKSNLRWRRLRRTFICLAVIVLCATGCSPKAPAPPEHPAEKANASSEPVAASPSHSVVQPATPSEQPASKTPAAASRPEIDPALRNLASRLIVGDGHGGWRRDERAATDLEKMGPDALGRMWPLLHDQSADVRRGTAFALLGQLDPSNSQQAAAFVALLGDSDATVRGLGLDAVKELSREQQLAALSTLAAMLTADREPRPDNRAKTARLLGSWKADGAGAAQPLASAAAGDADPKVRSACLVAIAQVAPPEIAAAALARGLSDGEASVRQVAAVRLRQLGSAAAPAAKDLAAALADENLRESAAETLIQIGAAAVSPLAEQLASKNVDVRKYALACLAKIGPAARGALPAIEKCRQDPDENIRTMAALAAARVQGK